MNSRDSNVEASSRQSLKSSLNTSRSVRFQVRLRANAVDELRARVDPVYKGDKATDLCVVAIEAGGDSF